jgi:predicted nucleotidyltransferase component of viral defense system
MIPSLLTKQVLQLINRRTLRYTPVAAEKDYFLTLALKILSQSSLYPTLVFKGGTAIHHCYLSQSRFSEDLDEFPGGPYNMLRLLVRQDSPSAAGFVSR